MTEEGEFSQTRRNLSFQDFFRQDFADFSKLEIFIVVLKILILKISEICGVFWNLRIAKKDFRDFRNRYWNDRGKDFEDF